MNRMIFVLYFLTTAFLLQHAAAGGALVPLRPGDSWQVELLDETERTPLPGAKPTPSPTIRAVRQPPLVIEKNLLGADFRQQLQRDATGKLQAVRWIRGGLVFYAPRAGGDYEFEKISAEMRGGEAAVDRLLEFDWLSPKWAAGTAMVDGVECLIYFRPSQEGSEERASNSGVSQCLAAIGKVDGRPRRHESTHEIRRYVWRKEASPPFPPGATRALESFNQSMRQQARRHNVPR